MELCSILCGSLDRRRVRGEWIHVHVWPSPFTVPLKLSQHYLLTGYKKKKSKKHKHPLDFIITEYDLKLCREKIKFPVIFNLLLLCKASLVAQTVKNLPAMQETQVWSLGRSRSPAEGNGNPLWYSCLEYSMDRGDLQATVHGVPKSWTQLSN